MTKFRFIVDSDIHFQNREGTIDCRSDKKNNSAHIVDLVKNNQDIECVILCGDYTEHGTNGQTMLGCIGGGLDEFGPFIVNYLNPIKSVISTYMCAGNHETYVPWPYFYKPVFDYIKKNYGALRYSFDIQGVQFVCCNIYPDPEHLDWLAKELALYKEKDIIIFFHYNMIGHYSDFWAGYDIPDKNKIKVTLQKQEKFYDVIKDYNIVAILGGHLHSTKVKEWKGIPTFIAGGGGFALCTYDNGKFSYKRKH